MKYIKNIFAAFGIVMATGMVIALTDNKLNINNGGVAFVLISTIAVSIVLSLDDILDYLKKKFNLPY